MRKCLYDEQGFIVGDCSWLTKCTVSDIGTYIEEAGPQEGQVIQCGATFEGCTACDSVSCNACEAGYYLSRGRCLKCDEIEGCMPGMCS